MARTELEQLIFSMDANVSKALKKMDQVNAKSKETTEKTLKHFDEINAGVTARMDKFAEKFTEGFTDKIKEGANEVPILGRALGALGPLAIVAAAAVGGVAFAVDKAKEAMDWSLELQHAADKLGITTEALQEYQFAAKQTGVDNQTLRTSILNLNASLGAYQSGVGDAKLKKVFEALGISRQSVGDMKDFSEILPILAEKISALKSTAEQTQLARKLGIEDLLPLLRRGKEGLADMREEAQKLGLVIGGDTVRSLSELAEKAEIAHDRIDVSLKRAFVGIAPVIESATEKLADFVTKLSEAIEKGNHLGALEKIATELDPALWGDVQHAGLRGQAAIDEFQRRKGVEFVNPDEAPATPESIRQALGIHDGGTGKLKAVGGGTKHDGTDEATKAATALADAAKKASAQAMAGLVQDIAAKAQAERDAAQAEYDANIHAIAEERAKSAKDKTIKDRAVIKAQLDAAQSARTQEFLLKNAKINADEQTALDKKSLDVKTKTIDAQIAVLKSYEAAAVSRGDKAYYAQQINELERGKALSAVSAKQAADDRLNQAATPDGVTYVAVRDGSEKKAVNTEFDARKADIARQNAGPLDNYLKNIRNLDDELQNAGVSALSSFTDQLAELIVKGGTAKDMLHNLIQQLELDMAKVAVQQTESALFHLFGFANGTESTPGGPYVVGEHGPELMIGKGMKVIPNHVLNSISSADRALSSGAVYRNTVIQGPRYVLNSPVVTQDLLNQMNSISARHANAAEARAVSKSLRAQPGYNAVKAWEQG